MAHNHFSFFRFYPFINRLISGASVAGLLLFLWSRQACAAAVYNQWYSDPHFLQLYGSMLAAVSPFEAQAHLLGQERTGVEQASGYLRYHRLVLQGSRSSYGWWRQEQYSGSVQWYQGGAWSWGSGPIFRLQQFQTGEQRRFLDMLFWSQYRNGSFSLSAVRTGLSGVLPSAPPLEGMTQMYAALRSGNSIFSLQGSLPDRSSATAGFSVRQIMSQNFAVGVSADPRLGQRSIHIEFMATAGVSAEYSLSAYGSHSVFHQIAMRWRIADVGFSYHQKVVKQESWKEKYFSMLQKLKKPKKCQCRTVRKKSMAKGRLGKKEPIRFTLAYLVRAGMSPERALRAFRLWNQGRGIDQIIREMSCSNRETSILTALK